MLPINISKVFSKLDFVVILSWIVLGGLSILLENYFPIILLFSIFPIYLFFANPFIFYCLLFFFIPVSTELELGSLGTDFPTEPIMWLMLGFAFLWVLKNHSNINTNYIRHPITLLILLHISWILFTCFFSTVPLLSLKFFVAKIWYIVSFLLLPWLFIQNLNTLRTLILVCFSSLIFSLIIIIIRHGVQGFSFESINFVLNPFFRNHVTFASILVVFFPFLIYLFFHFKKYRFLLGICLACFVFGIYVSYTRAAYICLLSMPFTWIMYKWKLTKYILLLTIIVSSYGIYTTYKNNSYLNLAPDFNKTITHKDFDKLIQATYNMEDISTMERLYRWVAGIQMVQDRPFLGFGPNGFYPNYKNYTVKSFRTYVSDNPEKSGVHCYYFMVFIEQGIFGFIIFLALVFYVLISGQRIYNETKESDTKMLIVCCILSFVSILLLLLINDLLESDKVGSWFLFIIAILIKIDLSNHRLAKLLGP